MIKNKKQFLNESNKVNCHPESTTRHSERSEESKKRLKQESMCHIKESKLL